MQPTRVQVAGPDTLLGQLQRGRGRGYLRALEADHRDMHAALFTCLTQDPRHDRDFESRAGYYVGLVARTSMDLGAIESYLAELDIAAGKRGEANLALDALGVLAGAAHELACVLLREEVEHGGAWEHALRALAWEDVRLVNGLDEALRRRFPGDSIYGAMSDFEPGFDGEPWTTWRETSQWVAGLCRNQPVGAVVQGMGPRPSDRMSAIELLECAERGWRGEAGTLLGRRENASDVSLLVAVARDGRGGPAFAALRALRIRRNPAALEVAISRVLADNGSESMAALTRYIVSFSERSMLARARDWFTSAHQQTRMLGERILARHAEPRDVPMLRTALQAAQAAADPAREMAVLDALSHLSDDGPCPEVVDTYLGTPHSLCRHRAATVLAATDAAFARTLAVESLWDCEPDTVELACRTVDVDAPDVRERLRDLAGDERADDGVRDAAAERLA